MLWRDCWDGMTLESHPSLEMCDLVMLKFPPGWNIVELAHLRCGLIGSTEYFLSPPSFCSSSHPRGALSGRTSMSGPKVCGFEHHSLSLARCQHSSWFCCQTQPFDQKGLIRARFSPSEAAVFKSRGSIFMSSPSLLAQARLMGTRSVRQIMRWMALFKHLLPEALQTAPSTQHSLNSWVTSALAPNCSLSFK